MPKKLTQEEFINRANKVHNNKYDYSNTVYINAQTKVKIICPEHGEFEQEPDSHVKKRHGCIKCAKGYKPTTEEFIEKAKTKFPQYDYSKVEYINGQTKVKIICHYHGEWEQIPANFLRYRGCPKCANGEMALQQFIDKSNEIHKNKYDYSLVKEYRDNRTKVKIICPEHGEFEQIPGNHLQGADCPVCGGNPRYTTDTYIKKAISIHGDKYDYSLVNFRNALSKIKIICSKHGIFKQAAYSHIDGKGCPSCRESKGEKEVAKYLTDNSIEFERQKRFDGCKNSRKLPFDFYLPKHNICIEYDGIQHFEPVGHWGGKDYLKYIQINDKIKDRFCYDNNIKLVRIRYDEDINLNIANNNN